MFENVPTPKPREALQPFFIGYKSEFNILYTLDIFRLILSRAYDVIDKVKRVMISKLKF
jgi:hypothetical protein